MRTDAAWTKSVAFAVIGLFLLGSARLVLASLRDASPDVVAPLIIIVGVSVVAWCWPREALFGTLALLPSLMGLENMGVFPFSHLVSAGFAACVLGWSLRRITHRSSLGFDRTVVGVSGGLAMAVVAAAGRNLIGLDAGGWREMLFVPLFGYEDSRFAANVAQYLLSGIVLILLLQVELRPGNAARWARLVFNAWLLQILFFTAFQLQFQLPPFRGRGVTAPFQDIHAFGAVAVTLFAYFAGETTASKRPKGDRIGIAAAVSFLLVVLSYSRTAWITAAGILLMVGARRLSRSLIVPTLAALLLIAVTVNVLPQPATDRYPYVERGWSLLNVRSLYANESFRRDLMGRAVKMIETHPWVGTGLGSFRAVSTEYAHPDSAWRTEHEFAHNAYLQLGAEAGLPALALFIALIVIHRRKANPAPISAAPGIAYALSAYLVTQLTSNSLMIYEPQMILCGLLLSHWRATGEPAAT